MRRRRAVALRSEALDVLGLCVGCIWTLTSIEHAAATAEAERLGAQAAAEADALEVDAPEAAAARQMGEVDRLLEQAKRSHGFVAAAKGPPKLPVERAVRALLRAVHLITVAAREEAARLAAADALQVEAGAPEEAEISAAAFDAEFAQVGRVAAARELAVCPPSLHLAVAAAVAAAEPTLRIARSHRAAAAAPPAARALCSAARVL